MERQSGPYIRVGISICWVFYCFSIGVGWFPGWLMLQGFVICHACDERHSRCLIVRGVRYYPDLSNSIFKMYSLFAGAQRMQQA
jgi:hypothetical protein